MKKMKIIPILIASALLTGCSGTQTGLRAPKDFSGEGKEISFKEGSAAFLKKFEEAKFDDWKLQNYSSSSATYTRSSATRSHTKANVSGKRFTETCTSNTNYFDTNTKSELDDYNNYVAVYNEGSEYDSSRAVVDDITLSSEATDSSMTIFFADGTTAYVCSPLSRTYRSDSVTGFDFDKYAFSNYANVISDYDLASLILVLQTIEGSSEDVYKKAWREYLTVKNIFPESVSGETLKMMQNDKVFTVNLEQSRSYDNSGFTGTTKISARAQIILDAQCYTLNYEKTTNVEATGDGISADDKIKLSGEGYFHKASWIDMGGSVEKPKLENYIKVTTAEK